ncbi:beta strand repeat-containing protein [Rugamonas aquatica]|uniref:DUF4214 domain-containing protein n=1 Tax=Rugamonas aquatica TaxID=2743357 RepID=A0A6A7N4I7_9BURK|nr:DUF4214 domain-containing protein [Rugamonas aquatica]MQA39880.1 DUF4214 domain-containing protein [Rugamonas aquatica]
MAATDYAAVVQQLYISYFGRPADYYALQAFTTQLAAADTTGGTLVTTEALSAYAQANPTSAAGKLVASFAGKPEAVALYGTGTDIGSISKFVNAIYQNVLHRDADNEGGAYWINAIVSGGVSKENAALAITQGALGNTSPQGLIDAALVKNTAAVAIDFTNSLDTIPKINSFSGDAAAAAARGLLLQVNSTTDLTAFHANVTTAIANLIIPVTNPISLIAGPETQLGTAGNDVFNGTGTTFSALDSIDGGAGNNSLVISDAAGVLGGSVPAGVVVKNVQTFSVNTAAGLGTVGAAGTPATAQVNNYAFAAAAGADTVVVNYGTLSTTMNLTATAATNQANFIAAINALAGGTVATAGAGTSVNVTAPVAGTALPVISFSSFSVAGDAATITVTTPTANGAAVAGSTNAVYDVSGFGGLTNVTVNAAGSVNLKVSETTTTTVTDTANAAVTVTGGLVTKVNAATGAVIVAGNAGGLTTANVKGGSTVDVQTNASGSLVDKLTTVTLDGNSGAATIQSDALTTLGVANGNQNVTVTAAAATRALALTVNSLTGGIITDNTATTLTVKSTGDAKSTGVTLAAAAATAVTLSGDKALTLTSLNAAAATALTVNDSALTTISAFGTTNKLATVTVTGAGGLKADVSAQSVLTSVDASGSSGANSITLNAALTAYKGGSGVDTVTVATAPTVAIDGGAGTADVIIENSLTDILTGNTKITGFETLGLGVLAGGGNTFDATGFAHLSIASGVAGNVVFGNVAGGADLAITGAAGFSVGYSLANATGLTDVLSLKLSAAAAAANNVSAAGIETVNISVVDTNTTAGHAAFSETLTLSASSAAKLAITGNGTMGLTLIDTDTAITSADASGLVVSGTGAAGTGFQWATANLAAAATIKGSANGGDIIDGTNATKALTITVAGGTNAVTGGAAADTITAGNGSNTIDAKAGNDIITVGSGANSIKGGAGADTITLAAHVGKVDTIVQTSASAGVGDSGNNTALNTQTSVLTGSFDVVKGIAVGDKLDLSGITGFTYVSANLTFGATNLAAADGKVVFASGTYDAANGIFNYGASGADTIVTYDTDATGAVAGQSIVLVGYHASSTATTAAAGIVTLG